MCESQKVDDSAETELSVQSDATDACFCVRRRVKYGRSDWTELEQLWVESSVADEESNTDEATGQSWSSSG